MGIQRQGQIYIGGRRKRRRGILPVLLLLALAAGSAWPHYSATRLPRPAPGERADAVVVLAGGEHRIEEGVRAWRAGAGRELYIVGTGPQTPVSAIVPGYGGFDGEVRKRIHVEGWSETTLENAVSVKGIVAEHSIRTLVLVTSDYHMARAHLALSTTLPTAVRILPLPVKSEWKGSDASWRKARLFLFEAWKYWGYRLLMRWE